MLDKEMEFRVLLNTCSNRTATLYFLKISTKTQWELDLLLLATEVSLKLSHN